MLRVGTQQGSSSKSESCQELLNLERESCEHLMMTHLEQVQHCTDLPCCVTFQRTQNRERWGQGLDERYRSSREGEECGVEEGQEKRENRRPILRKLCAALCHK